MNYMNMFVQWRVKWKLQKAAVLNAFNACAIDFRYRVTALVTRIITRLLIGLHLILIQSLFFKFYINVQYSEVRCACVHLCVFVCACVPVCACVLMNE